MEFRIQNSESKAALGKVALIGALVLFPPAMNADQPKQGDPAVSTPAQCDVTQPLSACGLPSNVVIDMSRTKVRRTEAEWRARLTPQQYSVARQQGTEAPFRNAYWNNHVQGTYLCIGCDSPLFSSEHKFESGSGWPSFWEVLEPAFVGRERDMSHGMVRTEVHCAVCGSHLGHLFNDGPKPTRLRYCINSASLRFLDSKAYESWVKEKRESAPALKTAGASAASEP